LRKLHYLPRDAFQCFLGDASIQLALHHGARLPFHQRAHAQAIKCRPVQATFPVTWNKTLPSAILHLRTLFLRRNRYLLAACLATQAGSSCRPSSRDKVALRLRHLAMERTLAPLPTSNWSTARSSELK
jgi:hypothetical protein